MATITPTITVSTPHDYRNQMERIQSFAKRVHIDLMDGVFAPTTSVRPDQIWWPEGMRADVHLMFQNPAAEMETLIKLKPNLVVISAESDGDFKSIAKQLNDSGIDCGLALLAPTSVESVAEILPFMQHALIFSGNLGYQGGSAVDFKLLEKVEQLKTNNPNLEIAWDGGVSDANVRQLADGGIEVLNTGGFIQHADDAQVAYQKLVDILA